MGIIVPEYSGDGSLRRFVLKCETPEEIQAATLCPGAHQRTIATEFGLPADHTLFYRLFGAAKSIKPSTETQQWVDSEIARTKLFASLLLRPDCEGDEKLYPFQRVDVDIMKRHNRIINQNPMGSGKTVEWLKATDSAKTALIVVPKGLIRQWGDKTMEWLGEEATLIRGNPQQKRKAWADRKRLVVASYDTVRLYEDIHRFRWEAIGWDEGHRLTNRNSQRSVAAHTMHADHKSILTGTLMRKHVGYLFHPLEMMFPYAFSNYYAFLSRFAETTDTPWGPQIVGVKADAKPVLQYILSSVMIKREKAVILPFLPEKVVETVYVELTPTQRKLYSEMKKELQTYVVNANNETLELSVRTNGAKFTRLRQLLLDPGVFSSVSDSEKTDYIVDFCADADDKVVVFTWYREYANLLQRELKKHHIEAVTVHGANSDKGNEQAEAMFKKDPNVQVIIGTIAKLAEGYDFPMANTVIFADVSYIPDDNAQGEERIHRPGQTKKCRIIYLVARKTVDELVHKEILHRAEVINETMAYQYILKRLAQID